MLIPAIDLMGGRIVQLVHGETLELAFDDIDYWIERFRPYPLIQLIDLDAAKRQGSNTAIIERIARVLPCQVGGGVRTVADALRLLGAGVQRVIFGSALFSAAGVNTALAGEIATAIGTNQFVASIDTKAGRVAVRGWQDSVDLTPEQAVTALDPFAGGFLYTHVDTEGTMQGFPIERARRLRALTARRLIVAGGIRDQAEIDALHALHVDAVAGMAVYTGSIPA